MIKMGSSGIWKDISHIRYGENPESYPDATSGVSWQWRWIVGSIVLVPVLLAAGVYWLHQQPSGPLARSGDSTIRVDLIPTPGPAVEYKQASAQSNPPIADFRVAPSIAEPAQPSYEQEATPTQPVTAARPASVPQPSPAGEGQGKPAQAGAALRFQRLLLTHIERFQRYPAAARRDGLQGTVLVAFAMRRDGSVVRVGVKSSSGRPVLDQEAIETIRRAQPLPAIPSDMPDQLTVLLPVAFEPN